MGTDRIEAFSDGVFAIAITLLVLEIKLPAQHGSLARLLAQTWPDYVAYAISFITIGIMWANHHTIFNLASRATHGLVIANLLLLLWVAFLPFPTKVLGDHLTHTTPDQHAAAMFYTGSFAVTAIFYNVLWQTIGRRNRLVVPGGEAAAAAISRAYRYGVPIYVLATIAAAWSVPVGLGIAGALDVFYLIPRREQAPA